MNTRILLIICVAGAIGLAWQRPAQAQTLPRLSLSVAVAVANRIEFSWPGSASNFVLEGSGSLGATADWRAVSEPGMARGDSLVVSISGQENARFYRLRQVPAAGLFRVTDVLPVDGANEVGVTFRPRITFSEPVNPATLAGRNFFATAAGQALEATIVPSNEGSFAWLFLRQSMPGGSRVRVTVDGSSIHAANGGALLDADGDGVPGGVGEFEFTTVSREALPGTSLSGIVVDPGPDLIPRTADDLQPGPDGQLGTADDQFVLPIEGVEVFLLGREEQTRTTGPDGRFYFEAVPGGDVKVVVNGNTATRAPAGYYFPEMVIDAQMVPGRENFAMTNGPEVYLPRLSQKILQPIDAANTNLVRATVDGAPDLSAFQRSQLTLQVAPNSLIGPDGSHLNTSRVGISTVPSELVREMLPPGVLQHTFDITVQAPGIATFSTPAPMTFPNVFNATPGTQLNFLSFDHTTGRLVIEGTATVSADGSSVRTDPGTGITHPGWHGLTPPGGCGGSGGPPPKGPVAASQGEIVTQHKPVPLPFITGDPPENKIPLKSWTAPSLNPNAPSLPPIPGCNVPQHHSGEQQPFINVTIEIDGPLDTFMKPVDGGVHLVAQAFTLSPGTGEKRAFGVTARNYDEIFGQGGFSKQTRDQLYGARMVITVIEQKSDGTRLRDIYTYYQYRWIDVVDAIEAANRAGNTAVFLKTIVDTAPGGGFVRFKFIDGHLPTSLTTTFLAILKDPSFNFNFPAKGEGLISWSFDPRVAAPDPIQDSVNIQVSPGSLNVGNLIASGRAVAPATININTEGYKMELRRVIESLQTAMTPGDDLKPGFADEDDDRDGIVDDNSEYGYIDPGPDNVRGTSDDLPSDVLSAVYPYSPDVLIVVRTAGPDGIRGNADDVTLQVLDIAKYIGVTPGRTLYGRARVAGNNFLRRFAGFMPWDRKDPGPDGQLGTPDDRLTESQSAALELVLEDSALRLKAAVADDFARLNQNATGFVFVDTGGDVSLEWEDLFLPNTDKPVFGLADGIDSDKLYLSGLYQNVDLPVGAQAWALAEALHKTNAHTVQCAVAINISWRSPTATFEQFIANSISHEVGHTFGLEEAYTDDATKNPGTAGCDDRRNCLPFDLMRRGSSDDPDLEFFPQNTQLLEVAVGIHDGGAALDLAVQEYRNSFNLSEAINGIREEGDISEFGPLSPPTPAIALLRDDQRLFYGRGTEQDQIGQTAADGAGGVLIKADYRVINSGYDALTIGAIHFVDGTKGFSVAEPQLPGVVLAPGESRTLTVLFDPSSVGALSDTLIIDSDALSVPVFKLVLTGIGLPSTASARLEVIGNNNLGGARVGNGSAQIVDLARVSNAGTKPLRVSSIRIVEGAESFALIGVPDNLASSPVELTPGQSLTFGLKFSPARSGLQRCLVSVQTNDPDQPVHQFGAVGTGLTPIVYPDWGRDFVAIETPQLAGSFPLRTISDDNGNFDVFLPSAQPYHLVVFDPVSGLVAHDYGTTPQSGSGIDLTASLVFQASAAPDTDGDGLPDDVEFAIGTSANKADTDGNGLDDFTEIAQGLDPLGGRAFPTGIIASVPLQGEAKEVVVQSSIEGPPRQTAYVATGSSGLAIVDVTQFNKPVLFSQIELPGNSTDVAVDPNTRIAVVAGNSGGLHRVDVSDPVAPRLLDTLNVSATEVEVADGVIYAAVGNSLEALDVLSGDVLQTLAPSLLTITAIAREGTMLYTMDSGQTLRAVDISGGQMALRGSLPLPLAAGRLFVGNGIAYIAIQQAGAGVPRGGDYATVDVSRTDALALISGPDVPGNIRAPGRAIVSNGSGLGLLIGSDAGTNVLDVMNVSDPSNTYSFVNRVGLPAAPNSVAVACGIAFVADDTAGLQIINYLPFDIQGQAPTVSISAAAIDADPNTPGIQVADGSTINVRADVRDDVQICRVELLLNGQVVRSAVSFPFDLSATAPKLAGSASQLVLQLRATDTGGNTTLSDPLTLSVVTDATSPQVVATDPKDGELRFRDVRTVHVTFSKPMDAATINPDSVELLSSLEERVVPSAVVLENDGRVVELAFDQLQADTYQLRVNGTRVTDRAGNALGANFLTRFTVGPLTKYEYTLRWAGRPDIDWKAPNRQPIGGEWTNAVNWRLWVGKAGDDWNAPRFWAPGHVPTANDNVYIDELGANDAVVIRDDSGINSPVTVSNLTSSAHLQLAYPPLAATGTILVNNRLEFTTVKLRGGKLLGTPRTVLTCLGVTNNPPICGVLDGVTLVGTFRQGGDNFITLINSLTVDGVLRSFGLDIYDAVSLSGKGQLTDCWLQIEGKLDPNSHTGGCLTIGPQISLNGASRIHAYFGGIVTNRGNIIVDKVEEAFVNSTAEIFIQGLGTSPGAGTNFSQFINEGVIEVREGAHLRVFDLYGLAPDPQFRNFDNRNTLRVKRGGRLGMDTPWSQWSSALTTVEPGGAFRMEGIFITDTNQTSVLSGGGQWLLGDPQFRGGTITLTNGAVLQGSGTFNGVTLNGNLELTQDYTFVSSPGDTNRVNSTVIYVTNSFTLNGKMTLGDASGSYSANLLLRGPPAVVSARLPDGSQISYDTQVLDGDALIEFGGGEYNALVSWGRAAFLTIGPNVTVRGRSYSVGLPRNQVSGPFQNFIGLLNQGTIAADGDGGTVTIPAGLRLSSGLTIGCTNQGTLRVANGGTMNLTGPSLFNGGAIQVGTSGTIKFSGNYTQGGSGRVFFEINGLTAGTGFGQLNVSGAAALDGALNLGFLNGFQPSLGDAFDLIHWGSGAGTFSTVNGTPLGGLILNPEYQATRLRLVIGAP